MLSKEMYALLNQVPRYAKQISYADLNKSNDRKVYDLICEATYTTYDYLNKHGGTVESSNYSLTEKGQAAIEEYEQAQHSQKVMNTSLSVARIAMWAALASAAAAIASLIKMFV